MATQFVWRSAPPLLLLPLLLVVTSLGGGAGAEGDSRPNIVFVLADDYGFHDVGYHGSRIRTPNIDKLAAEGVKLENYYVQPLCSPTRSQLMSGRYQIHTGLQHGVINPYRPSGLPLDSNTLARQLKGAGYSTHMVGKWHLGFYKKEYLPNNRGFDSYFGFLDGSEDYMNHSRDGYLDFRDNLDPVTNESGHYSAHLFTQRASDVIMAHDSNKGPFFLYLPYQSVHVPLEVPERYMEQYKDIQDDKRRTMAGMVSCMDEGIGNLTAALQKSGLMDNTVFVFSTDNGGQVHTGGNNFPLRGWKGSLWEGGIHGVGFVNSPLLPPTTRGRIYTGLVHVTDWFPTFMGLAKGTLNGTLPLDGFDQWNAISNNGPSPRQELLHNIDPVHHPSGDRRFPDTFDTRVRAAIRVGDFKLITGDPGNGSWVPPPESHEQIVNSQNSPADRSLRFSPEDRKPAPQNVWLFNITADPEERHDLSGSQPQVVQRLLDRLLFYNTTAVPCNFPPEDPNADPGKHGGVWGPWQ